MPNKIGLKIISVVGIILFVGGALVLSLYPALTSRIALMIIPSKYGSVSDYQVVKPEIQEVDLYINSRNARVVSQDNVTLAFQLAGKVQDLSVTRGSLVQKDAVLIAIDKRDLELEEGRATELLNQAMSNLQKIKKGARAEDLAISSSKEKLSETTIDTQRKTLQKTLEDLMTVADDTFYNKLSGVFSISQQGRVTFRLSLYDMNLEGAIQTDAAKINTLFVAYKKNTATATDIEKRIVDATAIVDAVSTLYDRIAQGVNGARSEDALIQAARTQVADARSSLSQSKLVFSSAYANYKTAKESLSISRNETKLVEAGSATEDIEIAQAIVKERANQVQSIRNQISFTRLTAPSSNMIVKDIFIKKNETVSPGQPVILLAYLGIKVQVDVEEEDISSLQSGDEGVVYLRSFKDIPVSVVVDSVEPHEITKNESTYFRVNLELKNVPAELTLRTGMTGDLSLKTKKKRDALMVDVKTVYTDNLTKFVLVNNNGIVEKRVVNLKGEETEDGKIEIEGDIQPTTSILYK